MLQKSMILHANKCFNWIGENKITSKINRVRGGLGALRW